MIFSDDFWPKLTIVRGLKDQKFNKTPAFNLRGYGIESGYLWRAQGISNMVYSLQ